MFKLIGRITKPRKLSGTAGHYFVEKRTGRGDKFSYEQVPMRQNKLGVWEAGA